MKVKRILSVVLMAVLLLTLVPPAAPRRAMAAEPVAIVVGHTEGVVTKADVDKALAENELTRDGSTPFTVTFADGVTSIDYAAFVDCVSLTKVVTPDSMLLIGDSAFKGCTSLAEAVVGNSVNKIGVGAFGGCTSLTDLVMGNSVTKLNEDSFVNCTSLTTITVESGNTVYSSVDGVLFDKAKKTLIWFPAKKSGEYTVPNGVVSIGWESFSKCASLTKLVIPDSVTSIDQGAFFSCTSLSEVIIGSGMTSIDQSAFSRCTSLTTITVAPDNAAYSSMDGILFDKEKKKLIRCLIAKLGEYSIPNGVTSINQEAFYECTSLTKVVIPSSVTEIGENAFHYYDDNDNRSPLPNLTIYGTAGTYAQKYATANKIPFSIDNTQPTPINHTITFKSGTGAKGKMEQQNVKNGGNFTIPKNTFTRTGYTFSGWKGSDGKTYKAGATIQNVKANLTLTAQWKIKSYKVTLKTANKKQGKVNKGKTINHGKKYTIKATAKKGYKFKGWYIGKKMISNKAKYSYKVTKKVTLTAKFKKR